MQKDENLLNLNDAVFTLILFFSSLFLIHFLPNNFFSPVIMEVGSFLIPSLLSIYLKKAFYIFYPSFPRNILNLFLPLSLSSIFLSLALLNLLNHFFNFENVNKILESEIRSYPFLFQILFFALIPSICEEIMFRGVLLNSLKNFNLLFSILFVSLLFTVIHYSLELFLPILLVSLSLTFLGTIKGSLLFCIFFHFLHNFISILILNFEIDLNFSQLVVVFLISLFVYVIYLMKVVRIAFEA